MVREKERVEHEWVGGGGGEQDEVEAGVERVMGNVGLERVRRWRREEGRDEMTPRGGKGGGFLSDVRPACRCGSAVQSDVY